VVYGPGEWSKEGQMGLHHRTSDSVRRTVSSRVAALGVAAVLGVAGAVVTSTAAVGASTNGSRSVVGLHASMPARIPPASFRTRSVRPRPEDSTLGHTPKVLSPSAIAPKGVTAKVFTVTTLADSPLASPASLNCVDALTNACSLRAAVQAANNLAKPVVIKLGAHTYQLTDTTDETIDIENPGGTTIEGVSTAATRIVVPGGDLYGAFEVEGAAHAGSSATFSDLTISGGDSTEYGGAVYVYGYNTGMVLDDVALTHNAAEYGGGVACYEANLWITDSLVNSDTASAAGGGSYEYYCNSFLSHTTFNADTATSVSAEGLGGGLYDYYGNVHLSDCSVNGDVAGSATEDGLGGGVYGYYGGTTLVGTQVDHDTVMDGGSGGGVYLDYASLDATSSTFSYDQAGGGPDASGGGIANDSGAFVDLHGVVLDHDSTSSTDNFYGGGGIYVYSEESPSLLIVDAGSSFADDTTSAIVGTGYYGGVQMDISQTSFTANSSTLEGAGGIYLYADEFAASALVLTGDSFVGNRDTQAYSAGAVMAYTYEYEATTLIVSGCTIKGNIDTGEYGTGGIAAYADYYYSTVTVKVSQSTIMGNHATYYGYGGGVSVWNADGDSSGSLELDHDTIEANTAGSPVVDEEGFGGGVFAYYYVDLSVIDCTVSGNSAIGGGSDSGSGGGIYDTTYLGSEIVGSKIAGNHAVGGDSEGGGLYALPEYGSTIVRSSTIAGNSAIYGGGMYMYYYSLDIAGSTFADNVAGTPSVTGYGGGLYAYDTPASISNSTFTGNDAVSSHSSPGQGGAIYNDEYTFALYFVTMSQNIAHQGAAIYSTTDGSGTLRDSIVVQNVAAPHAKTDTDCLGVDHVDVFTSLGGNVLTNDTCVEAVTPSDVLTTKPGLGALAANGGPTETMALLATSPAIDAARGDCLASDQRGMARPTAGACDSGAYQLVKVKKHLKH
jgi:fibronectin-binding autotransporter adhesin